MRTILAMVFVAGCYQSAQWDVGFALDAGVEVDASGCECVEGACCDGCHFRGPDFQCVTNGMIGPASCSDYTEINCDGFRRITSPLGDRFCSGASARCDGERVPNGASVTRECDDTTDVQHSSARCHADPENGATCR